MANRAPAAPAILDHLPQDLRQITPEQFEAWVRYMAAAKRLTGRASLREWQKTQELQIVQASTELAKAHDPAVRDRLERGLANCRLMFDVATCAVSLQTWGEDEGWQAHAPQWLRDRLPSLNPPPKALPAKG